MSAKLSFGEKIGYSLGDTASNLFWQTFSMFLLYFYTDIFGISAAAAGTMFLVTRIWDTVNDPLMGIIADRTNSKWGKFRPYLLYLAVPFGVIGIFTFTTPDFGATGKMVYAYLTYSLMMMVYTAINIPYSALMGVLSDDPLERTKAASYRFVAAFAGGLVVQATALKLVKVLGGNNEALGWQLTMSVFAFIAAVLFITTFATTKERVSPPKEQKTTLSKDLKDLFKNIPWVVLFIAGIFLLTFVSIRNGSIMYYYKYYVGDQLISMFGKEMNLSSDVLASTFMVLGSAANIIGVLVTGWFSKRFGKKRSFVGLMLLTTLFTAVFIFLKPENVLIMFSLQITISFLMGPLSPIIWSMYTDTADYSEWLNGRRATGLVMSASTMAQKFGWTIGGAVAGWLLASYGFVANQDQNPETIRGIQMMISLIPAGLAILCAGFMFLYKLDEQTMQEIMVDLQKRREGSL
jgi:GPH family glycoside/pentoside/hexuronide:cation symporter